MPPPMRQMNPFQKKSLTKLPDPVEDSAGRVCGGGTPNVNLKRSESRSILKQEVGIDFFWKRAERGVQAFGVPKQWLRLWAPLPVKNAVAGHRRRTLRHGPPFPPLAEGNFAFS